MSGNGILARGRTGQIAFEACQESRRIGPFDERVQLSTVWARLDAPLGLGLSLAGNPSGLTHAGADEPWVPQALLTDDLRAAIAAVCARGFLDADDQTVTVGASMPAHGALVDWMISHAVAIAEQLRSAASRIPPTRSLGAR